MRITGNRLIDLTSSATTKNQSTVGTVSGQLSSGLRVTTPSDDPAAWVAAQRTKLRQVMSQGAGAAVATSRDALQMTDSSLASIASAVSQVRTLAVQGASDTYSAADRAGLGDEVHGLFLAALASANAQGSDGEYLLAGAASLTAPFDAGGVYQGDAGVRAVPSTDTGLTAGTTIAGSNLTAANGVDVLPLLDRVAAALSSNDLPTLRAALPDLDTAIRQISLSRSQTGAAMSSLDQTTAARSALEQDMQQAISRYVEVDTVTAATHLAKASQALLVSQQVTSHIIQLLAPST
jgi:flagellar hook-associated protein 3 FlgL